MNMYRSKELFNLGLTLIEKQKKTKKNFSRFHDRPLTSLNVLACDNSEMLVPPGLHGEHVPQTALG